MMLSGECTHVQFLKDDLTWYHQITIDNEHGSTYAVFPFDCKAVMVGDAVRVSDNIAHVLRRDGVSLLVPWIRWIDFPGDDGAYEDCEDF